MLGMGPRRRRAGGPRSVNAGKQPVTLVTGGAYFHHADSFAMIRGGHVDICVLGAFQVSVAGDLANWHTGEPGHDPRRRRRHGPRGRRPPVFVMMEHLTKNGEPKIVDRCTYPLTGARCVSRIYTDLAVLDVTPGGLAVVDLVDGLSPAELNRMFRSGGIAMNKSKSYRRRGGDRGWNRGGGGGAEARQGPRSSRHQEPGQLLRRRRAQGDHAARLRAERPAGHRRHHRQPDVRPVSDSAERRSARPGRDGPRLLPEQQDVGDDAGRPHGLERVLRAEGSLGVPGRPGVARTIGLRSDGVRGGAAGQDAGCPDAEHPRRDAPGRVDRVPVRPEVRRSRFPTASFRWRRPTSCTSR